MLVKKPMLLFFSSLSIHIDCHKMTRTCAFIIKHCILSLYVASHVDESSRVVCDENAVDVIFTCIAQPSQGRRRIPSVDGSISQFCALSTSREELRFDFLVKDFSLPRWTAFSFGRGFECLLPMLKSLLRTQREGECLQLWLIEAALCTVCGLDFRQCLHTMWVKINGRLVWKIRVQSWSLYYKSQDTMDVTWLSSHGIVTNISMLPCKAIGLTSTLAFNFVTPVVNVPASELPLRIWMWGYDWNWWSCLHQTRAPWKWNVLCHDSSRFRRETPMWLQSEDFEQAGYHHGWSWWLMSKFSAHNSWFDRVGKIILHSQP